MDAGLPGVGVSVVTVLFRVFTFTQFDPARSMHMAVAVILPISTSRAPPHAARLVHSLDAKSVARAFAAVLALTSLRMRRTALN